MTLYPHTECLLGKPKFQNRNGQTTAQHNRELLLAPLIFFALLIAFTNFTHLDTFEDFFGNINVFNMFKKQKHFINVLSSVHINKHTVQHVMFQLFVVIKRMFADLFTGWFCNKTSESD